MSSRSVAMIVLLAAGSLLAVRQDGCSLPDFGGVLPIPTPAPTGTLWLVVVEEKDNRNQGLVAVERDSQWRQSLTSRDVQLRIYDDDQPEAQSYVNVLGRDVAGVLVIDKEGKKYADEVLPADVSTKWFDKLLKEVGR